MSGVAAASGGYSGSAYGGRSGPPPARSLEDRAVAKEQMMQSVRESSQQDRRVYVGNLSYDVKWHHLKDFMRQAGEVLFADVLLLPNGMSKGCGIVEYATREQAQQAVATLSNQNLMGRLVYVREDREAEPRFTGPPQRGDFGGGRGGFGGPGSGPGGGGRQIYVANLPYNVGWQDLKDLFRQASNLKILTIVTAQQVPVVRFGGTGGQVGREDLAAQGFSGPGSAHDGTAAASIPANPFTDYATYGGERGVSIYVRNVSWNSPTLYPISFNLTFNLASMVNL
ncbi:uncharacterized protein TERG_08678 [Trichophyton rubrum CBS 118892]|uniref:RRM domain-containing protein n=1 Tax=Trichophyton rubrum (strain ATCC MYA-4607 / CBS 118892) TaxID=559305 RepID=A0A080WIL7_TRIRC|nr:uncharacterized protein TERG_08678 [Trichophyton rubrum CBS 118892]KFL60487.1 hypothetical protein TERG_08678 [Trichophyton rubrum CBS 118892]